MAVPTKKESRLRRAKRTRKHIKNLGVARFSVHRTNQHIYAYIIDTENGKVLVCSGTNDKDFSQSGSVGSNCKGASQVGKLLADRALAMGVKKVAFDRSGYKFHGRVKALAVAAREAGLEF